MPKTAIKIGPKNQGQRMSLDDFAEAEAQEGYLYELGRGIVVVTGIPNVPGFNIADAVRLQLYLYRGSHPGQIYAIGSGSDCKILHAGFQSERHPDLGIYKTPAPAKDSSAWATWIPDLMIEIVTPGSEHRDYVEKREEYLQFGVSEYWIIDEAKKQMLALCRERNQWAEQIVKPTAKYSTPLLPGLEFDLDAVFKAAAQ